MSDPLGLSIGTTNLVAARVGNQPVIRRSVLTLFGHAAPEVGVPSAHADGIVLTGFVERVGDPVPLVAADGSSHQADQLLVDALQAMVYAAGGPPSAETAIAVPAHWGTSTLWALRTAMRTNPTLAPNGMPARLVSDAVASLTTLHVNPGLSRHGVVALLDFGGGGTSITLADAAAAFEPMEDTTRYTEFSGDLIDQALLNHVIDGIATAGGIDPAGTAAVGSLARLREECRNAKEGLSGGTGSELTAELPGYRAGIRLTRAELESLIAQPLDGVLAALENSLVRNRISWSNVSSVVTIGGGASIPLITQRLSEHSQAPVVTTPQPAVDAAVGAALFAGYGSEADAKTGVAPVVPVIGPDPIDAPGSATFRALAWSQDDDIADDVVPYTGDVYDTGVTGAPPSVQYVPAAEPIEEPRKAWHRLPQLVFGLAAVVALVAVGGGAVALTGGTDSTKAPDPPSTATSAKPPTSAAPPPSSPPPVETVTITSAPPPPPPTPTTTVAPPTTPFLTTTTTPPPPPDPRPPDPPPDNHDDDNNDHDNDDDHNDADNHHHDNHNANDDHDLHQRAVRAGADSDSGAGSAVSTASAALSGRLLDVSRMVAGGHMCRRVLEQCGLVGRANLGGPGTARAEAATGRRVDWAWHIASQHQPLARGVAFRIGNRHRRQQGIRVRVNRPAVQVFRGRILNDLAEIHHRDPVGNVADHAEVMRHEQVRQAELVLKVLEQVDDLRLHRYVERGHRFVGDDEFWMQGQRPCDADALALTAGELVGIAVVVLGVEADSIE